MVKSADRIVNRLAAGILITALGLTLCGCMSSASSLDQLGGATPSGSPFAQNLFKNYAYLARSFGPSTNSSDERPRGSLCHQGAHRRQGRRSRA
jgi:hypothetical protein